jgi:putative ABC transport system permease protein
MEEFFGLIAMDDLALVLLAAVGAILLLLLAVGWRNRVMLRLGLRNVPRRRAQTALIVFGLMLSTLIIAAAFGTGDTMTHSFRSLALDDLGEVDELISTQGGASFITLEMEFGEDEIGPRGSGRGGYFDVAQFESLAGEIARLQAAGDPSARLVEALAPVIDQSAGPVINHTARRSEASIGVMGYDPASADAFDELHSLDGKLVTLAGLGPGEVYLSETMARLLDAEAGHELEVYLARGQAPLRVTVKAVVKPGGLPGQMLLTMDRLQEAMGQPGKINNILVSNAGGPYAGKEHSAAVSRLLERLLAGKTLQVQSVKEFYLFATELLGSIFATMFIGLGSFSIAAALLLIFLIFVMLAAERKQEMGMARAVGTRRRHLVQMFVFEGTIYDLLAAAVGALLGAAVGLVTVGILARGFKGVEGIGTFQLRHHLEPRSVIVAYCLGVLLTFVTVAISSWRVSRLNIVSAIRDLPPPSSPDAGLRALFAQPWRHLSDAFRQLLRLRPHRTLKRLLWDGPRSSLAFFWALIGRGPLTVLLGFLLLRLGQGVRNLFAFNLGVSLILIGIGLIIRWTLRARGVRPETRDRLAFSFAGISLLVYWSLPFDALDSLGVSDFSAGPEMFALSGVMMVAGAVWTIIYNSDLLLGLVTRLLSPFSSLLPVVRTAIAYPMSSKFRTGLTIAMFALVIFMLVFMSVFVNMLNEAIEEEDFAGAADRDIRAYVVQANPIPDLKAAIAAAPELNGADYVKIERRGTQSFSGVGGNSFAVYEIKLADGVDARETARALESAFVAHGLVTEVLAEEIQAAKSMINTMFGLMQAFMGLGLIVGSASVGIVSTRAVVERRQQIGVLRAIGYKPWMIQWSFLLEASFVALLGILIGIGLGLILAYNFFNGELASAPGSEFSFSIPWATLGIVVAIAYAVSMLTTYLPSWQAGRIYPAEALRYE